jgi:hypothetical protein
MDVDKSIVRLGEKLDAWWDGFSPMLDSEDRVAQGEALLRGFAIAKEFDRLKADGLAAITALLDRHDSVADEERVASLIRGFEFGARLADTLHDEFRDTADGETKVVRLMDAIVKALDTIGSGRAALATLLDHPDPGVRALAGAYLIDLLPERVGPILRQIEEEARGRSAGFRAHWALLAWQREGKSRGNPEERTVGGATQHSETYRELLIQYRRPIVDRLVRIYEAGDASDAQDRFLIIDFPSHPQDYVQCVFDTRTKMLCEASSGFFYTEPRSHWLPAQSIAALGRLGFSTDDSAGNFRIWLDVADPPDFNAIADFMLRALHDGYGARADMELRFNAPFAPETSID